MFVNFVISIVLRGRIISISEPCSAGQYLDPQSGCQDCPADQWSTGGIATSCSNCPDGKGVEAGLGSSEEDCVWSK